MTAGLAVERGQTVRAGQSKAGDLIYLVGSKEGALGATRYQVAKNGKPLGKTVAPDYEAEKKFRDAALATARAELAESGRVVAGGGLAAALANEAIASGVGMEIAFTPESSAEALLFSEGGPRAIYSVAHEKAADFEKTWSDLGCEKIGEAGGNSFNWHGIMNLPLSELISAFMGEN